MSLVLLLVAALLIVGGGLPGGDRFGGSADAAARHSPAGRVYTADETAGTISVVDVAINEKIDTLKTGEGPHHLAVSPDGDELWVTLYGENHLHVFTTSDHSLLASIDLGGPSDDLSFSPDGTRCYVTLGKANSLAVVDVASRKLLSKIPVGQVPHGVRTAPGE